MIPSITVDTVNSLFVVRIIETVKMVQRVEGIKDTRTEQIFPLSGGDSSLCGVP